LAPGDLVAITVYDHPDLTTTLRVPAAGALDLPLIGAVDGVAGRTPDDLADEVRRRLADGYVRDPHVAATVTVYAPRNAYVLGAVARPAAVALDPFATTGALQAVAASGGFAADADRAAAQVVRDDGRGGKTALRLPADEAAALVGDVALEPGDLVIVPRLDRAFVTGQVAHPGPIELPSDEPLTVSKAISLAGGFDRFAKQATVQLIRPGQAARTIDVRAILSGKRQDDAVLKPGDLVFVPESRF
jgi:polysaccharide export outer membrane protein